MKWYGFGHRPDEHPGDGDLALFCAACPQVGVNLEPGWEQSTTPYVLRAVVEAWSFIDFEQMDLHKDICHGRKLHCRSHRAETAPG